VVFLFINWPIGFLINRKKENKFQPVFKVRKKTLIEENPINWSLWCIMREENGKVCCRHKSDNHEKLMYYLSARGY
jgi:hypothetical protein